MILCIKNTSGKEVELTPVVSTREEITEIIGNSFTLDGSDYQYSTNEIYAKSQDKSIGISMILSLFVCIISMSIKIGIAAFLCFYIISKIYFYFDKKAAEKFNNSGKLSY